MKNSKKAKIYYRYDRKGSRKVLDILEVNPYRRLCTFYNNCDRKEDRIFKGKHLTYNGFVKKINKLAKAGYQIENVDGVSSKVPSERVERALNIELPFEAVSSRNHFRISPSHYFSRDHIVKTKDAYLNGQRNDAYLDAWVLLYNHALQESIRHGDKKRTKIVLARCSCISEFGLILKDTKRGGKKKSLDNAREARSVLDKGWSGEQLSRKSILTKSLK